MDTIRQSELLNRLVIDRSTMEEIGRVEVLWTYVPAHRVLGFISKSGFLGGRKTAFNLGQLHTIGSSILVNSAGQETDAEKVSQLESLVGCEVWSDTGTRLGKIVDFLFNPQTGVISDYLFTPGGFAVLTEGVYRLPPRNILSTGRSRVLVTAEIASGLVPYREGIKHKLSKVSETLKEEYLEVTEELRDLTRHAQGATEQAKQRAKELAERAKELAQTLNEQLREEAQQFTEQAWEQGADLAEDVRDRSQTIGSRLRERADDFEEQVRDQVETLNEKFSDEFPEDDFDTEPAALEDEWDIETPPDTPTIPHLDEPYWNIGAEESSEEPDWDEAPVEEPLEPKPSAPPANPIAEPKPASPIPTSLNLPLAPEPPVSPSEPPPKSEDDPWV